MSSSRTLGAILCAVLWMAASASSPAAATAAVIQIAETLADQEQIDAALGALGQPPPPDLPLAAPPGMPPPFAGQPFDQQPEGAQGDFLTPEAGRR